MDEFFSLSGARTDFEAGIAAIERGDWDMAERKAKALGETIAQGDWEMVLGSMVLTRQERR